MIIILIRTVILYIFIVFTVRIMGKRQIGQLQPSELVVMLMISQLVVMPLEDKNIPMLSTAIPLVAIASLEIISSIISLKSNRYRALAEGNSVIIIRNGVLEQKQLKKLRLNIDDVLEALRKKDIFDISTVDFAFLETDGTVTAMLKTENRPVTNIDGGVQSKKSQLPCVVISDGQIITKEFKECDMTEEKLSEQLKSRKLKAKDILLMTADKDGNINIIKRDTDL